MAQPDMLDTDCICQGKLVARVLSGRAQLPEKECMEEAIEAFYQALRDNGLPIRYTHSQSGIMPEDQWSYNDSLGGNCCLRSVPDTWACALGD